MEKKETKEVEILSKYEIYRLIWNMLFVTMHSVNISMIYSFVSYGGLINTPIETMLFSVFLSVLITALVWPFTKKVSKANLTINIVLVIYLKRR